MPVTCVVPPLYGTMVKLVPAIMFKSPTLTCDVGVLIPIWKVPGLAFSRSTRSLIELTGMLMFPTTAEGTSATSDTGTKSLNGSYASLLYRNGFMTRVPSMAISRV